MTYKRAGVFINRPKEMTLLEMEGVLNIKLQALVWCYLHVIKMIMEIVTTLCCPGDHNLAEAYQILYKMLLIYLSNLLEVMKVEE